MLNRKVSVFLHAMFHTQTDEQKKNKLNLLFPHSHKFL
jgi:hypothetical protein